MDKFFLPVSLLIMFFSLLFGVSLASFFDFPTQKTKHDGGIRRSPIIQSPKQVLGGVALFGVGLVLGAAIFSSYVIAAPFAFFIAAMPSFRAGARRRRNAVEITQSWPDAIDHLSSAIRAGLNLSESLSAIGVRGPAPLRPVFIALGNDLATGTSLERALVQFCAECNDPIADQLTETILIAHEVGGSEIGRLLRTFSQFLRLEIQTRDEIRVRQGWVVNGARIAAAAPWILLALLSLRQESVAAYQTPGGILTIVIGGFVSVVAYLWMRRLAQLGVTAI